MINLNVAIDIEDALDEKEIPSKTYCLNFEKGRIIGKCDGIIALKQFIHKVLITSRGNYPVLYTDDYGSDIENAVLGESTTEEYLTTVIPQLVKDCLLVDDRISDVYDITAEVIGEKLFIKFCVASDFGNFDMQEVI